MNELVRDEERVEEALAMRLQGASLGDAIGMKL